MTIDKEAIKSALDNFEDDNFVDSKEILSKEIKKAKNDYLKDKLGLKKDVEDIDYDDEDIEKE